MGLVLSFSKEAKLSLSGAHRDVSVVSCIVWASAGTGCMGVWLNLLHSYLQLDSLEEAYAKAAKWLKSAMNVQTVICLDRDAS